MIYFVRLAVWFVLLLTNTNNVFARPVHGIGASLPAGQLLLSLGNSDLKGGFVNWMKACGSISFSTGASPASLDANGYPNVAPPGATISLSCQLPTLTEYSGTWEIGWSGTGEIQIQGGGVTIVSDPHSCSIGTGGIGKFSGTNCDVIFSFNANLSASLQFNSGFTFSGMNNAFLIRSSDKAAYLAGQVWSTEMLGIIRAVNPLMVRTMGMTFPNQAAMAENSAGWNYRTPAGAFSYNNAVWFPNLWSSSITGTDQYVATGATDTPATWTDREMLQGNFANASATPLTVAAVANNGSGLARLTLPSTSTLATNQQILLMNGGTNFPPEVWTITVVDSTHIDLQGSTYSASWNNSGIACGSSGGACLTTTTIDIQYQSASRGPKFLVGTNVLGNPNVVAGANATLVYDATLAVLGTSLTTPVGAVIYNNTGVNSGVPIEAQVALANELNVPLWANMPPLYQASDAASLASYVCAATNNSKYLEYNNENWNFRFQAQWLSQHGLVLGLSAGSNVALASTIGLNYRLLMGAATAACPQLHRIDAASAQSQITAAQHDTYQFNGTALCGTSCGNSIYQAFVGTDYNTFPNRPLDYSDYLSVASYFGGPQENGNAGSLVQLNGTCNGTSCTGIIAASACYASPSNTTCGTGGTAQLALNFIDNDTSNGKYADGTGTGQYSTAYLQTNVFGPWNTIAVNDNKPFIAYEGGYSGFGQTATYLTGIGDANATADATNINNLIIAYRQSSLFKATFIAWHQQWMSNSQMAGNSNLQLEQVLASQTGIGSQFWGLMSTWYLDFGYYQSFYAACTINNNQTCHYP